MRSRQVVCNNPRVLTLLEQFIPTAEDPNRLRLVKEPARQRTLEYRLATEAIRQTGWQPWTDPCQGMYVFSPSGKLLAGGNRPLNVEHALNDLRQGLDAYAKMPRHERLLDRLPDAKTDRIYDVHEVPRPPADGLVLRVAGRGFEENLGGWECPQLPRYYSLDRLWFTRDEALQFLPDQLQQGQRKQITGPAFTGLARLYLIARGSHWEQPDIKEVQLAAEVAAVTGSVVEVQLSGRAVFEANRQFNSSRYRPDLLGQLTYDTERRRFTRFDLVAFGLHNIGSDRAPRGPEYFPMGLVFSLNGTNVNDHTPPYKLDLYRWVGLKAGRE